ncbi:tail spike protein [Klebsiella phage vB_Kpn_K16PH164C3]|uniref:Probable tail spike protein n=1 Tax=Klebsiella phage vB_Kpn_K16PH164C3 TaxID=3071625 RepID=A0AAV1MJY2_9CAUD|nr:tail spike protein [Klebsiella phage vB_Kpn_K16PH164C3]
MDQDIKTVIQYPVGATEFDIPFDYLSRKFVRVSLVTDDNRRLLSNITEYRYVSKTRVKLLVATTGFDRVEIRRFTSASERIVDFSDGSVLRASDLNVSQLQSAHIAEEARDAALMAMPQDDAGNLDARNRRIVRLAPGIDSTDAINKNQLDTTLGEAGGILSDMKDLEGELHDYIEKFADDTALVRGVAWVYNLGSANGGENVVTIDKPTRAYAVPYIAINGARQEVGYHYQFDINTQSISLVKPLEKGDFLMAMTTESSVPLESILASPIGASGIGTLNGMTVQEAFEQLPYVPIEQFGAKGDGVTDDTDAVQAALASGKNLSLSGTYLVKSTLSITKDGQKLIGAGGVLKVDVGAVTLLKATGVSNVSITGVSLQSSSMETNTYNGACIWAENCSGWVISGCLFSNYKASALFLNKSSNFKVVHNTFKGAAGAAGDVTMWRSCSGNVVSENTMMSGSDTAIVLQTIEDADISVDNIISYNRIANCTRYGIVVYNSLERKTGSLLRTRIIGNSVDTIYGSVTNPSAGNSKTYGAGIYVLSAEGVIVSGNSVSRCNLDTNSSTLSPGCIGVNATSNAVISNNVVMAGGYHGIFVSDALQQGAGNGAGSAAYRPIGGVVISGNTATQCVRDGIHIENKHSVKLIGNTCTHNSGNGVLVSTTSGGTNYPALVDISVEATSSLRNGLAGLSLSNCQSAQVINGSFSWNTGDGVSTGSPASVLANLLIVGNSRGIVMSASAVDCSVTLCRVSSNSAGLVAFSPYLFNNNIIKGNTTDFNGNYGPVKNLTGSATPSVKFVKVITLGDSTTITDLLDGELGQTVVIRAAANGTTVVHSTNGIRLNGSVNFVMQAGDTLTLTKFFQSQWDEVSRMTRAVVTS